MNLPQQQPNSYSVFTDPQTGYNPCLDDRPIDQDGVLDLLSLLAGSDFRKPDPVVLLAWSAAAQAGRWVKGPAFRAAVRHITTSTEFAKPAHITALMKLERDTVPDNRLAIEGANPATSDARTAAREFFRRFPQHLKAFAFPPPGTARARQRPDEAKRHREEAEQAVAQYWTELDARRGRS